MHLFQVKHIAAEQAEAAAARALPPPLLLMPPPTPLLLLLLLLKKANIGHAKLVLVDIYRKPLFPHCALLAALWAHLQLCQLPEQTLYNKRTLSALLDSHCTMLCLPQR